MKILTADYVLPISSEPIPRGAVAVEGEKIVAVDARAIIIEKFPAASLEDFGTAAILPGFVNCHSHLEITSMRGALDSVEHDFTAWLMRLTALRADLSDEDLVAAATLGVREGLAAGVTCFGDIGRSGFAGFEGLRACGARGIVFQETNFSPRDETAADDFAALIEKFEALRRSETEMVRVGLSPHSPYTVSAKLLSMLAEFARNSGVRLSIHAAESRDENEFLTAGSRYFKTIYDREQWEWNSPGCSPIEHLARLGVLDAKPLLAHCVTVSDSDLELIRDSGSSVAHCPKSNAKFGHGYAPLEKMLDAGIVVGLGSDSVASNNICDLLEEGRFASLVARNRVDTERLIAAEEILRMATLGGAQALAMDDGIGSLEPGKQADITIISLDSHAQQPVNEIAACVVFSSSGRDVLSTIVAGEERYRRTA